MSNFRSSSLLTYLAIFPIVYLLTKNVTKELPSISVKVVLFDLDTIEDQNIQDSFDDTLDTWQDTFDDNDTNIQDEV